MTSKATVHAPKVLVIDDDSNLVEITVVGLRAVGMDVQGVTTRDEALDVLPEAAPCCVLVDLRMPDVEGLSLVKTLCDMKRHAVILLSAYVDVPLTVDAMRKGVVNVLTKPVGLEAVIEAVEEAWEALAEDGASEMPVMTRRERQVAELIVQGMTAKQIAQKLELSPRTIEFFRANLMRKTQSPNSAALAAALARVGFS